MRDEVAKRLAEIRRRRGYATPTEAATAHGWKPSTYLGHEGGTRGVKPDVLRAYAVAFACNPSWLAYGIGSPDDKIITRDNEFDFRTEYAAQHSQRRLALRKIPRVTLHKGTTLRDIEMEIVNASEFIQIPASGVTRQRLFYVVLEDDSMRNLAQSQDSFRRGDRVLFSIVSPGDHIDPGKYVLARVNERGCMLFRRYRVRGTTPEGRQIIDLVPLNDDFETHTITPGETGEIVAIATDHIRALP